MPNLLIYLVCDVDVVMKRIHLRQRSGEMNIDVSYVKALQASFDDFVASWTQCPILTIDSEENDFRDDETIRIIAERALCRLSSGSR